MKSVSFCVPCALFLPYVTFSQDTLCFKPTSGYQVLSQVGQSTVANIVDPQYTVVAKFPKKYQPK